MDKSKIALKEIIYNFGLMFNQQPSPERIDVYADTLAPLGEDGVKLAFQRIIKSGSSFFPSIAEIYEAINPKKTDESAIVASEIIKLVRVYGPHAENELMQNCSPLARRVILQLGSLDFVRNSENTETIRAQLERLARSISQKISYEENKTSLIASSVNMKRISF